MQKASTPQRTLSVLLKEEALKPSDPSAVVSGDGSIDVSHATSPFTASGNISRLVKMIYPDGSEHHAPAAKARGPWKQDVKEDHFVQIEPVSSLRSLDLTDTSHLPLAAKGSSRMSGRVGCRARFVTGTTPSFSSGVVASNLAYTPTSATDFSTFAALYSEYKVDSCEVEVRPTFYTDGTDGAILFALIGNDPAGAVATPTATNVRLLDKTIHLQGGGKVTAVRGEPQKALAAVAQPSSGGWLAVGQSWPGQFCLYLSIADGSASFSAAGVLRIWTVSFRNRFA